MDLKEAEALGDQAGTHWYYVSKARMITRHLPRRSMQIVDVGAGLGWFSHWLLDNGYARRAVCVDPGYEAETEETRPTGGVVEYRKSITAMEADVVLMMDVLEHVDDDVGLLRQYWELAPPGTVFIITVPAFKFLWSAHDDYLDHRRRYTVASLRAVIEAVGARPAALHYFFACVFPAAAVIRLATRNRPATRSDMKPAHPIVNAALKAICGAERLVMRANRLAGLSVVARLEKPAA